MSSTDLWQISKVKVLTSVVIVLSLSLSLLNFEDKRRFDQRVSPRIVGFFPGLRHILCPLVLACLLHIIFMFYLQFIVMLM